MGAVEDAIIEQCDKDGRELPPKIANRPELWFGLDLYWKAFWDLTSDRVIGMEEGSIPTMTILQYACYYDFNDHLLLQYVRSMDNAYLRHFRAKAKRESDRAKSKIKNG